VKRTGEKKMKYPYFFPQSFAAAAHGIETIIPVADIGWRWGGGVSETTKATPIEAIGADLEQRPVLSMQWMVCVDADGRRCLRAQWESRDHNFRQSDAAD
jgi:hypothetical protein